MGWTMEDLDRLGPDAQRQVMAQLGTKENKYHNCPTVVQGIRFDSRKEARRYQELMALLRAGQIRELKLQPQFTLQEAYTTPEGKRVRAIRYVADFSYERDGTLVVEDVKSRATKTRVYGIKAKLLRERHGLEITEV